MKKKSGGYYSWDTNKKMRWVTELPDVCERCGANKHNLKHAEYQSRVVGRDGTHKQKLFVSDQAYICMACGHKSIPIWGTNLTTISAGMGFYTPLDYGDEIVDHWVEWEVGKFEKPL